MEKTFLGKIIAAIVAAFIGGFPDFVRNVYKKIPDELKEKLIIVIEVVDNIRDFIDSPTADLITKVIPGYVDDELKDWLREVLPEIIDRYKNSTAFNPEHDIAAELTHRIMGGEKGQALITTEIIYQNTK